MSGDRDRLNGSGRSNLRKHVADFAPRHPKLSRRDGNKLVQNLDADGRPESDQFLRAVGLRDIRRQHVEERTLVSKNASPSLVGFEPIKFEVGWQSATVLA